MVRRSRQNRKNDGLPRSPIIMDNQPTAQVFWQIKTATVERQVTVGANGLCMSLRTHEVTMSAAGAGPETKAVDTSADLELGAHVADADMAGSARSESAPVMPAALPRWIPEALEPA